MTSTKTTDAVACKAVGEIDGKGVFEALVSVFGNIDRDGDRVMPGAFAKSLVGWRAKGRKMPVVWAHQRNDPFAIIGSADPHEMKETDVGLVMRASLDLENPHARQVYGLMKQGLVDNFSYTYEVKDARRAKDATELLELDLIEAGPCLVGANQATTLLSIKAAENMQEVTEALDAIVAPIEEKAGAAISRANRERLAALRSRVADAVKEIDDILGTSEDDDGKTADDEPIADESRSKTGDEPTVDDPDPTDARELTAKAIRAGLIDADRFALKHTA